jgi:hypothetical protein
MVASIKLAGLVSVLVVIFFPSFTLAQDINFGVSPSEVRIDELHPGEMAQFELTINNKDETARNFTITTFAPSKQERREGRAEFPDDSWVTFSCPRIEIGANSRANVIVTTAIPGEQKWAGKHWELWLGVTPESSDLLAAKLYVRLLVSTRGTRVNAGLVAGIVGAIALLSCGGYYYFRRRARPE